MKFSWIVSIIVIEWQATFKMFSKKYKTRCWWFIVKICLPSYKHMNMPKFTFFDKILWLNVLSAESFFRIFTYHPLKNASDDVYLLCIIFSRMLIILPKNYLASSGFFPGCSSSSKKSIWRNLFSVLIIQIRILKRLF